MSNALSLAAVRRELLQREAARRSMWPYVQRLIPHFIWGWFHEELCTILDQFIADVEARRSPRLMLFCPPRHSKSSITTRAFTSFALGRHPEWEMILASATLPLAQHFGREIRNDLLSPMYQDLFPHTRPQADSSAVDNLRLDPAALPESTANPFAGGFKAVGIEGNILGFGAHIMVVDDPIASRDHALSKVERDKLDDWFTSNAASRLAPGGGIILMHQRHHPDDLAGRLLARASRPGGTQWKVVEFPAIAIKDEPRRKQGEALQPEWYSVEALRKTQAELSPEAWAAMYQQRPVIDGGAFFKADFFTPATVIPPSSMPTDDGGGLFWYLATDLAVSTTSRADHSAIIPVGVDHKRNLYVAPDFTYDRLAPLDSVNRILDYARKYRIRAMALESGPLKHAFMAMLKERMRETNTWIRIEEISRSQAKHVIADTYHARLQQGKVIFPDTALVRSTIIPQHLSFVPEADNAEDDFIDAMANLCRMLDKLASPAPVELPTIKADADYDPWDDILRNSSTPSPKAHRAFRRLNGDAYG